MGFPEEVERVDEEEENKRRNKRTARREPPVVDMSKRLMADYSDKPSLISNEEVQMMLA